MVPDKVLLAAVQMLLYKVLLAEVQMLQYTIKVLLTAPRVYATLHTLLDAPPLLLHTMRHASCHAPLIVSRVKRELFL
jgi:hypothetical protein